MITYPHGVRTPIPKVPSACRPPECIAQIRHLFILPPLSASLEPVTKPDGHAHRFRDTFAVGLLQAGVPIERVSVLLGHSSIKVTEKY